MPLKFSDAISLEVVYKVQETCNINCTYCYMYNVGNDLYKSVPKSSPIETAVSTANYICDSFSLANLVNVNLIIHGGEPMLMPAKQFQSRLDAMEAIFSARLTDDQRDSITLTLQTNATLVSDDWLNLIVERKIHVGVSIDGPKSVHDRQRIDVRGRGSYDAAIKGVLKLRGAVQDLGVLTVMDPTSDGAEVYKHLTHDLGFTNLSFLFPFMNWENYNHEVAKGIENFVISSFSAWLDDVAKGHFVYVRSFFEALEAAGMIGRDYQGIVDYDVRHLIVVVESDGTIMPDESMRPTYSERFYELNVARNSIIDLINDSSFQRLYFAENTTSEECSSCFLLSACKSGRTLGRIGTRFSATDDYSRKSVYCDSYISLLTRASYVYIAKGSRYFERLKKNDLVTSLGA